MYPKMVPDFYRLPDNTGPTEFDHRVQYRPSEPRSQLDVHGSTQHTLLTYKHTTTRMSSCPYWYVRLKGGHVARIMWSS